MNGQRQTLEQALFELAAQKSIAAERAEFLDGVCRDNPSLRARLEALLEGHFAGEGFLTRGRGPAATASAFEQAPAQMIGRYKLLEKIGEGGFGEVWMAEQREPVKRRVAFKIIKLGMDSRQIVARFEAERQALAMMDHANIARIYDADVTDTGRPYFVMELVRGTRITEFCDQNKLPTPERLTLFVKVCQAIQHAHQKGIIHRDIKPSNILVTLHDGVPVPKVIDFGIAKAMQGELTDKTVFTQFTQFIGTPTYISPEQAETSGLDIDTRSDIYGLGVLLYELLVGQTPFDPAEMVKGGLDALRRIIREKEPIKPSTRLKTLPAAELTRTAHRRQTEALKLTHQLRGDLDWIVMKCLEKDRTRRYDTANGLAMDVQRYLANEPVVARPPSTAYKIQKMWQRNKLAFTAGGAVALALVVGTSVSTWQAINATRSRKAETQQRLAADTAREQAVAARQLAETARANEAQMRRTVEERAYAADMNLAQQALLANNLGFARELLDRNRPRVGQPDRRGWEWRYLWQRSRSDALYTLCQQSNEVAGLAVSPDGKWLAIQAGGVSIWNLASRQEVMRIPDVDAVAFSPTRPLLAMWNSAGSGAKYRLRLWDADSREFLPDPASPDNAGNEHVRGFGFTLNGEAVAAASPQWGPGNNVLTVWRISDGKALGPQPIRLRGPGIGWPASIAGQASLVALAEEDRWIRVIDLNSGSERFKTQATSKGWIETVALSADGRILAASSGTDETTIELWDVPSGRKLGTLDGHSAYVIALVFWPDGKTLASAGADQTIRLWDVAEKRPLAVLRGQGTEIRRLALLPDNTTLISGARDGTVMVWDTAAIRQKKTIVTLPSKVFGFWAPGLKGNSVLVGAGGWLTRWHGREFQEAEPLVPVDIGVCLSADQRLLATGSWDGSVKFWDVPQRKFLRTLKLSAAHSVSPVRLWADNSRLAVWKIEEQLLAIYDAASGAEISAWPALKWGAMPDPFSPDGRWCITDGQKGTALVRNLPGGSPLGSVGRDLSYNPSFSPDGHLLAIPLEMGVVRLFELPALKERAPLRGFLRATHSVAFSPDGQRLAVGSTADESLKLWDLESGQPMITLPGEGGPCWETAFSPDGGTLLTRHELGILDIWRVPSWAEIRAAEKSEVK